MTWYKQAKANPATKHRRACGVFGIENMAINNVL